MWMWIEYLILLKISKDCTTHVLFSQPTMASGEGEVICVTGGSGFIGSWIVHLLLRRGYTVRATVKNLGSTSLR